MKYFELALLLGLASTNPIKVFEELGEEWGKGNKADVELDTKTMNLKLKITEKYLSGFSSGAFMATNMMRLEPEAWSGAAIGAGNIYYDLPHYTPDVRAKRPVGKPGPKNTLKDKPLYFHVGTKDTGVPPAGVEDTLEYFKPSGANLKYNLVHDFYHVWPNNLANRPENRYKTCGDWYLTDVVLKGLDDPTVTFMNNCGYNLAYYMLDHLWTQNAYPRELKEREMDYLKKGSLVSFDQRPFATKNSHLLDYGYLYLPDRCVDGFLEYAASNDIVVLFPQNDDHFVEVEGYPETNHCWRAWDTDDKHHPQFNSIHNMVSALVLNDDDTMTLANKKHAKKLNPKKMDHLKKAAAQKKVEQNAAEWQALLF